MFSISNCLFNIELHQLSNFRDTCFICGFWASAHHVSWLQVSRGLVGRLMADPAFAYKAAFEELCTVGSSLWWEYSQRQDRFFKEFDLVCINTASAAAATAGLVWLTASNRSYGAANKFPWQDMLHSMPSNIFDASTPYKRFSYSKRAASIVIKSAELCAVGSLAGAAMSGLSQLTLRLRQPKNPDEPNFQPTVPVPGVSKSAVGMGAYVATVANARYQAVSGLDRAMFEHCNVLWLYIGATSVIRLCSTAYGEQCKRWFQGIPTHSSALVRARMLEAVKQKAAQAKALQLGAQQMAQTRAAAKQAEKAAAAKKVADQQSVAIAQRQAERRAQEAEAELMKQTNTKKSGPGRSMRL